MGNPVQQGTSTPTSTASPISGGGTNSLASALPGTASLPYASILPYLLGMGGNGASAGAGATTTGSAGGNTGATSTGASSGLFGNPMLMSLLGMNGVYPQPVARAQNPQMYAPYNAMLGSSGNAVGSGGNAAGGALSNQAAPSKQGGLF